MTQVEITAATEADVPVVYAFLRVLAEHDRDLHKVTATEADLRRSLFEEPAGAECVIARLGGKPVGSAIFCPKFASYTGRNEIYIEDLVVDPSVRGRGIGLALLARIARIARDRGATRLEWFVNKTNESAIGFYRRLGARAWDHIDVMRLSGEELARLAARAGS